MSRQPFGLLELGSNSLKFYRVEWRPDGSHHIDTQKLSWRISHTFFPRRELLPALQEEVVATCARVREIAPDIPLHTMLTVATGVFRELSPLEPLRTRLKEELGLRLRVISGRDEAKLMVRDFSTDDPGAVLLCDVGGATTEWALVERRRPRAGGSVRLGAIRNHYAVPRTEGGVDDYLKDHEAYCERKLSALPLSGKSNVIAVGGTAKALALVCQRDTVGIEDVRGMIRQVLERGPPAEIPPARAEVLLPGLVILERIAARCHTDAVTYGRTSVRDGMAARLVKLLDTHGREDLHSTLLLHEDSSKRDFPWPPAPE
jgi:exopolyphosphatase/guanosine-5'-triphosphate,3'-diphosphate pyrophosphatase